ncbi:hypothetical protein B0T24DRAFT_686838 [Lasiosphaeria ovina]|uniref:Uncharacterized protein n=1 Tax=Lasiosphaeria ovina TaxID=92902 RepID=A0AAE0NJH2_9PEZI|nr:hypothetical protein B0T24DRAFT_686838 [Lasiosphaeria ovina]
MEGSSKKHGDTQYTSSHEGEEPASTEQPGEPLWTFDSIYDLYSTTSPTNPAATQHFDQSTYYDSLPPPTSPSPETELPQPPSQSSQTYYDIPGVQYAPPSAEAYTSPTRSAAVLEPSLPYHYGSNAASAGDESYLPSSSSNTYTAGYASEDYTPVYGATGGTSGQGSSGGAYYDGLGIYIPEAAPMYASPTTDPSNPYGVSYSYAATTSTTAPAVAYIPESLIPVPVPPPAPTPPAAVAVNLPQPDRKGKKREPVLVRKPGGYFLGGSSSSSKPDDKGKKPGFAEKLVLFAAGANGISSFKEVRENWKDYKDKDYKPKKKK